MVEESRDVDSPLVVRRGFLDPKRDCASSSEEAVEVVDWTRPWYADVDTRRRWHVGHRTTSQDEADHDVVSVYRPLKTTPVTISPSFVLPLREIVAERESSLLMNVPGSTLVPQKGVN